MHDTVIKEFETAQNDNTLAWQMWLKISDDPTKTVKLQMDSGCCGMSMISDQSYYPYGLADGKVIRIHTAEKNVVRTAANYGIAAGSVPTISNIATRTAGPRQAIQTGLAVCDPRIHDLVNENRFDINLDGSNTPHRVDKKNRCVWMYEGTDRQFITPLEYDRDALYIDYRPMTAEEQVTYVAQNPLKMDQWLIGDDTHRLLRPANEVLEVQRQETTE